MSLKGKLENMNELIVFQGQDIRRTLYNNEWYFLRSGSVYPWQLEYYSAIGINNFKFAAYPVKRANFNNISFLKNYLEMVENGIEGYSADTFINQT